MVFRLFSSLLGRAAPTPATPGPGAGGPPSIPGALPTRSAPPPHAAALAAARLSEPPPDWSPTAEVGHLCRPLLGAGGVLAGLEMAPLGEPVRPQSPVQHAQRHAAVRAVFGAMQSALGHHPLALAELSLRDLFLCQAEPLCRRGMYLVLRPDESSRDTRAVAALLRRLRQAGACLGWRPEDAGADGLPGRPDFLALSVPQRDHGPAWESAIGAATTAWPELPLLLLDPLPLPLAERLLQGPVVMSAASVGLCEAPLGADAPSALALRLLPVLGLLGRLDESRARQALRHGDPLVTQHLLSELNQMPGMPTGGVTTLAQARKRHGDDALREASLRLLARSAPRRPGTPLLHALALARARLLHRLGQQQHEPQAPMLYVLGLATVIPELLQADVDDCLARLLLPPEALAAIAEQEGPWMRYLTLLRALERNDLVAVEALSAGFGGLGPVLQALRSAWLGP
ncbi:hypothetical protein [Pseudaquabacterium rugosum]|uniref:HDOD domain-containing protein n=1 Tax=Pseudaquabacterium rugosum TaxID=2984194 RepID=A0ABU9B9N2_9BURK